MAAKVFTKFSLLAFIPVAIMTVSIGHAEVVLHGTGTLLTGNIEITQGMGSTQGGNLFHSFNTFNVQSGESATFTGASSIHNVISRVTGTSGSLINGPVTVGIGGANFYFINPNGVIIGAEGSISATGSIYLSTADAVRFSDGTSFYADANNPDTVFSTADPVAFGFLSTNPAPIELNGPWLADPVPPGKTFALVGGDISVHDGDYGYSVIIAPGATVSLASVASSGNAILGAGPVDLSGFAALGDIRLSETSVIDVGDASTGSGAGSIYIRGGQLTVSGGGLAAQSFGDADGGAIDIAVRGNMILDFDPVYGTPAVIIAGTGSSGVSGGDPVIGGLGAGPQIKLDVGGTLTIGDGSFITSESYGPGTAGDIHIRAGGIDVVGTDFFTGITGDNYGTAAHGPSITIETSGLSLLNGGFVGTTNYGPGAGGDVSVTADSILAVGTGDITLSLSTETIGGNAGNLSIATRTLELRDGARISASTDGFGDAGTLNITATESITASDIRSGIFSSALAKDIDVGDAGNGGAINVSAPLVRLDGAVIDSSTIGDGNAGTITVHVGDLQLTNGGQIRSFSGGINAITGDLTAGTGAAGSVNVEATGSITASGVGETGRISGLLAETRGSGAGGNINVSANTLALSKGAKISSGSINAVDGGEAGNINISLGDSLTLNNSIISTRAVNADGGNINIIAPRLIRLNNSQITTSVENGNGAGGNIFIDPQFFVTQNSQIIANAYGGPGGNIALQAGLFILDPATVISASSALGVDGTVSLSGPESDLSSELAVLPDSFLDASRLMHPGCGAARAGLSSLVEVGRGGLAGNPDDYLPSLALDLTATGTKQADSSMPDFASTMRIASAAGAECWH